jgi:GNAT superfamily N-acetyltransferase
MTIALEPAALKDAESLADLRLLVMRESLERIHRFDPHRARHRLLGNFSAEHTRHVTMDKKRVGLVVVRPHEDGLLLDHLYVHPDHQRKGVGAGVLSLVFAEADLQGKRLRVGALKESEANAFYLRHGFRLVEQAEWDNYYVREPGGGMPAGT